MDDGNNNYFVLYTSQEIKYLRIIEVKGVGYENTPEKTKKNIENLIEKKNKKKNNNNYNNVIHCIWFCVSETRLEKVGERELLFSLLKIYKENKMPIILVFTKADDSKEIEQMKTYMNKRDINNEFIPVLAEDDTIPTYGKEKLIKTTLEK